MAQGTFFRIKKIKKNLIFYAFAFGSQRKNNFYNKKNSLEFNSKLHNFLNFTENKFIYFYLPLIIATTLYFDEYFISIISSIKFSSFVL